jgi:hypothetical protein
MSHLNDLVYDDDQGQMEAPDWIKGFICGVFSTLIFCLLIAFFWWVI